MSYEKELFLELRDARKRYSEALAEENEAHARHQELRKKRRESLRAIEEILMEIETGCSGRPILDRINSRASPAEETADERQRGPTAAPAPAPPAEPGPKARARARARASVHKLPPGGSAELKAALDGQAADPAGPLPWVTADLERELEAAIYPAWARGEDSPWPTYRAIGAISDSQILEVLRSLWPSRYRFERAGSGHGHTVHGGVSPAFWIGPRRTETMNRPTLEGAALVHRVRGLLDLPRTVAVKTSPAPAPAPPAKSGKRGR